MAVVARLSTKPPAGEMSRRCCSVHSVRDGRFVRKGFISCNVKRARIRTNAEEIIALKDIKVCTELIAYFADKAKERVVE